MITDIPTQNIPTKNQKQYSSPYLNNWALNQLPKTILKSQPVEDLSRRPEGAMAPLREEKTIIVYLTLL